MADLSEIETGLVTLIAGFVFPSPYLPGALQASVTGTQTRVYRGWPLQATLMDDTRGGAAHVSVFPEQGMTRNVSTWIGEGPAQVTETDPTVSGTISGATVTLSGTATAGNVIGVQTGAPMAAYAYALIAGDTLTTAAAALAAKVPGATSSGTVITLATPLNIAFGAMVPQSVLTITRQQQQAIRVSVWAPTPAVRDALCSLIDGSIAGMKSNGILTRFFPVTQFETAKIEYRASYVNDQPSREGIWRRDLCYYVTYNTTLLEQNPVMMFGGGPLNTSAQIGSDMDPFILIAADGSYLLGADGSYLRYGPKNGILDSSGSDILGADGAFLTSA